MRKLSIVLALAFALAACGGASSNKDGHVGNTAPPPTFPTVTPSAACEESMRVYSAALVKDAGPAGTLDEGPLQLATLNACTRDEWLNAVLPYRKGDGAIAIADPVRVLTAMCSPLETTPKACH